MGSKRIEICAALASTLWLACGLGHLGTGENLDGVDAGDGSSPFIVDASMSVPADTGPACLPTTQLTDALTTIDTTRWQVVKDGSNGDHPKVVTGGESPLAGAVVSLVTPGAGGSRGGLWLEAPVPTRAFDVTVSMYVACATNCGDGLVVAWMDTKDRTLLDAASSGHGFGIPANANGGAVALDLYVNTESMDHPTPNLGILQIDGTKTPGNYAWAKSYTPKTDSLLSKEHTLTLRMRKGTLDVNVDGATVTTAQTASGFPALFGIAAATGGGTATFLIRSFTGAFYDCDP